MSKNFSYEYLAFQMSDPFFLMLKVLPYISRPLMYTKVGSYFISNSNKDVHHWPSAIQINTWHPARELHIPLFLGMVPTYFSLANCVLGRLRWEISSRDFLKTILVRASGASSKLSLFPPFLLQFLVLQSLPAPIQYSFLFLISRLLLWSREGSLRLFIQRHCFPLISKFTFSSLSSLSNSLTFQYVFQWY